MCQTAVVDNRRWDLDPAGGGEPWDGRQDVRIRAEAARSPGYALVGGLTFARAPRSSARFPAGLGYPPAGRPDKAFRKEPS
ncbi:MAG: hypothetical protein HY319_17345 [Armatimonadetes bacterium]|nr:hypothetical protein [Armatimonadota bacterium]